MSNGISVFPPEASDQEKCDYLNNVLSAYKEEGLYNRCQDRSDEVRQRLVARQIMVTNDLPNIGTTSLNGVITSADETAKTLTFDGTRMRYEGATIVDIDGNSVQVGGAAMTTTFRRFSRPTAVMHSSACGEKSP